MSHAGPKSGFTLVELLVALVILTAGMLAMASASGYSILSIQMASSRTQRSAAVGSVVEEIRAKAYDRTTWNALPSLDSAHAEVIGRYRVWYAVGATNDPWPWRQITLYSSGPSYRPGAGWKGNVKETFTMALGQPVPIP